MVLIAESEQVWVMGRQVDDDAHWDGPLVVLGQSGVFSKDADRT